MDVLDVHVVIHVERARPDPEVTLDVADLAYAHERTETRDLGGPFVADDAHAATITITRCLPTQHCPTEAITLAVNALDGASGAAWLVQWPWAWVEPPEPKARGGEAWTGTRRVAAGSEASDFGFGCTLMERRWKGGHIRCTGTAEADAATICGDGPCLPDFGGSYTLDIRLDWITGEVSSWHHTLVTFTGVNGDVARRTVTTSAKVTKAIAGP